MWEWGVDQSTNSWTCRSEFPIYEFELKNGELMPTSLGGLKPSTAREEEILNL